MKRLFAALACCAALLAGPIHAATITPLSYVATVAEGRAQGGAYDYFDDGGRQLIDGVFGSDDWTADLGNGRAREWVGWRIANPVIVFDFGSPVSVAGILLGMVRSNGSGIYIGLDGTANGQAFGVDESALVNNTRGDLPIMFAQALVGPSITLRMSDRLPQGWLFFDEIRFVGEDGTAVIPLPGALALMLPGLALLGATARRVRGRARA